ncbi:MAG: Fe-S cluster protein, partial [Aeromicrobium sp.]|uniref:heterodisulfide reductase-related iron-sulfur binding cluster n=1 Tax=Aeromicrobium sp. TaxID=1871063 RepID=UPI00261952E3
AGNEIVFAQLAMQNAEVFKETKVKKVVSTCAHCFNTLKNEYAEFGVELEVVHHTQLLNRLVREGKLKPLPPVAGEEKKKITYHDPCFLGRHNQVYEPPRELLNVIPGAEFTEMPRNQEKSFCCGAGGARMWMEESLGSRINVNRTEEAIATGADQIAVGCPFCRVMLSDGLTLKQSEGAAREEVEVLDVAQMLLTSVKRAPVKAAQPTKDDDKAVVAEAATAGAVADTAVTDKATEAEPDAEDKADPDSISDTADAGAAAKAHEEGDPADKDTTDVDELDEPAGSSDAADQATAAESNVKVDESGGGHADESAAPDEPRNADARAEAPEAKADAEPEAKADAEPEVNDDPASEKEEAAWANVGPVNTDLTPSEPAADKVEEKAEPEPATAEAVTEEPEPAPEPEESPAEKVTHVPDETEPVEEDAREEEADAAKDEAKAQAPDEITSVDDIESTADPVSEDIAELSDANPSGKDLSAAATQLAFDDVVEDEPKKDDATS